MLMMSLPYEPEVKVCTLGVGQAASSRTSAVV